MNDAIKTPNYTLSNLVNAGNPWNEETRVLSGNPFLGIYAMSRFYLWPAIYRRILIIHLARI
jgi:hypothetical protein